MEDDMRPYIFVAFLLLLGAAVQQPETHDRAREGRPPDREAHDKTGSHGNVQFGGDYIITPSPGYIITPSGQLIFPDAQPPAGDTSTLSGAGPDVSTGPVVGSGPEVSTGPEVGSDLDYPQRRVSGTGP